MLPRGGGRIEHGLQESGGLGSRHISSKPFNVYPVPALEATQGQMDGFFSQLPYKCYRPEVASVED